MSTATQLDSDLASVARLARLIGSDQPLNGVLEQIVREVCRHRVWTRCSIMRVDEAESVSRLVVEYSPYRGRGPEASREWQLSTSPTLDVLRSGRPLVVPDATQAVELPGYREDALRLGYRTVVVVPLADRGEHDDGIVLAVSSSDVHEVDAEDLEFLSVTADLVCVAMARGEQIDRERARSARLLDALDRHDEAMARVLDGAPTGGIVEQTAAILRAPHIVVDLIEDAVYAHGVPREWPGDDDEWQTQITVNAARALCDRVASAKHPQAFEHWQFDLPAGDWEFTFAGDVCVFHVDGETVGGLILLEAPRRDDDSDDRVLSVATDALKAQLMRRYVHACAMAESLEAVVNRLLDGDWRDWQEMRAWARRLGVDLDGTFRMIAVAVEARAAGGAMSDWYVQRLLERIARGVDDDAFVCRARPGFVVFVREAHATHARVERCVTRIANELERQGATHYVFAPRVPCTCGEDYAQASRSAAHAIRVAAVLGRTGAVDEADFGPYGLLLAAASRAEVDSFIERTIGPLRQYDAEHDAAMVETLQRFLEHRCRYRACADALGIHVSTLRYRLERIAELTAVDLEQPDRRFTLELALRLADLGPARP